MSYFPKLIPILSLFCVCYSLNYYLPKELCKSSFNFSGISIGSKEFEGKPLLIMFAENNLWYWGDSNSENEGNWASARLPWNWTTDETGFAVFDRNFVEDINECQQNISDFFVIWYNPKTGHHEYDIYSPIGWYYFGKRDSPPLLKEHYIFRQLENRISNKRLTSAFSLNEFVILFQGSHYYPFRLNQTNCGPKTNLSSTVSFLQENQLGIAPISSFYYTQVLYFFTKSESNYKYETYSGDDIINTKSGQIGGRPQTHEKFFECQNPLLSNTSLTQIPKNSSNEEIIPLINENLDNNKTNTVETINDSPEPSSSKPTSDSSSSFMAILVVILLVSLIIALIICVICCYCYQNNKTKPSEGKELEDKEDKKNVSTGVSATNSATNISNEKNENLNNSKPNEGNQVIGNADNNQIEQNPEEDNKTGMESNKENEESAAPRSSDEDVLPRTRKTSKKRKIQIKKVVGTYVSQAVSHFKHKDAPDEGKPKTPYQAFP